MFHSFFVIILHRAALTRLLLFSLVTLGVLFVSSMWSFLAETVVGDFPADVLLSITPTLFLDFLIGDGVVMSTHQLVISILVGTYAALLWHLVASYRKSALGSMATSILGLLGISIGITCISCGALLGLMLASALGAASAATLVHAGGWFLLAGEISLVVSIMLVLHVIRRFSHI